MPPKKGAKSSAASEGESAAKKPKVVRTPDAMCPPGAVVYEDYDCMLNQTNVDANNNKFYVIQVFQDGSSYFCWTRWGRVGDLGQNATLGDGSLGSAIDQFNKKFKDKTGNGWSDRASFKPKSGKYSLVRLKLQVEGGDEDTKDEAKDEEASEAKPAGRGRGRTKKEDLAAKPVTPERSLTPPPAISKDLAELISYIFREAKAGLTNAIDATITANGIETPLGVLSLEQVDIGEKILQKLVDAVKLKSGEAVPSADEQPTTETKRRGRPAKAGGASSGAGGNIQEQLKQLSSEFFTAIPHRFGRSRPPVLDTAEALKDKADLLQLMRDLVTVGNSRRRDTLANDDAAAQYATLGCTIEVVDKSSAEFQEVVKEVKDSQERSHGTAFVKIVNVYRVRREEERTRFTTKVTTNHRRLYHGSRITNWVGLLSRGILMPKVVVTLGVHRTDAGWLGSGIYFGEADTAAGYAGYSATKKTAFMLMVRVALGRMKDYSKITYGLSEPPSGYDSTHGVAGTQFYDNEYVVYDASQQYIEYLIEFKQ